MKEARKCGEEGCKTILSMYNLGKYCFLHQREKDLAKIGFMPKMAEYIMAGLAPSIERILLKRKKNGVGIVSRDYNGSKSNYFNGR